MPLPFPIGRRLTHRDQLTVEETNALLDYLESLGSPQVQVGTTIGTNQHGQPIDFRPQGFWAQLTADRTGNRYGWIRVSPREDGSVDVEPSTEAMTDQGSPDTWPAVEVNGAVDLLGDEGPFWLEPGQGAYFNFDATRIANWTAKTGDTETEWRGGRWSVEAQSFKGEKTFRDKLTVADNNGKSRVELDPVGGYGAQVVVASAANGGGIEPGNNGEPVTAIPNPETGIVFVHQSNAQAASESTRPPLSYVVRTFDFGTYGDSALSSSLMAGVERNSVEGMVLIAGVPNAEAFWALNSNGIFHAGPAVFGNRGFWANIRDAAGPPSSSGFTPVGDWVGGAGDAIDLSDGPPFNYKLIFVGGVYAGRLYGGGPSPPPPPPPPPPATQGSIHVSAWLDTNADGTWGEGELPAAGRLVILSGPSASITTTDAAGHCFFANLAPGGYLVTVDTNASEESCAGNANTVTVIAGAEAEAGRPIVSTVPPSPPVSGVVVIVQKYNGTGFAPLVRDVTLGGVAGATGTGSSSYQFSNLAVGAYTVEVTPNGGDTGTWAWTVDTPGSGSGTTTDSFLTVANQKSLVTFTFTATGTTYSISGTVLVDGSPAVGREMTLSGTASGTAACAADGHYEFTGLAAGTYAVAPTDVFAGETHTPSNYTGLVVPGPHFGKSFAIETPP